MISWLVPLAALLAFLSLLAALVYLRISVLRYIRHAYDSGGSTDAEQAARSAHYLGTIQLSLRGRDSSVDIDKQPE